MLSPVVITISKGNRARSAAICAATSYDGWSPVPKSPMTANLSESVLFGSPRLTPRALGTDPATAIATNHLRANRRQRAVATITARSPPSRVGEKVQMPNRARVRRRFPSATSVPRLQRRAFPALAVRCGKIPHHGRKLSTRPRTMHSEQRWRSPPQSWDGSCINHSHVAASCVVGERGSPRT